MNIKAAWAAVSGLMRATVSGVSGAFMWVLSQVLTEKLFRGFAIDVAAWFVAWVARTIPGTADDVFLQPVLDRLGELKAAHAAGKFDG